MTGAGGTREINEDGAVELDDEQTRGNGDERKAVIMNEVV